MNVIIECPSCGERDTVLPNSIGKRARCNSCSTLFFIKDAIVRDEREIDEGMAACRSAIAHVKLRNRIVALVVSASIVGLILTYWFVIRDTWESDNAAKITAICNDVVNLSRTQDDRSAVRKYRTLIRLVGDREIKSVELSNHIEQAETVMREVEERLENARQVAEARERRQQIQHDLEMRNSAPNDINRFHNPYRNPPFLANLNSGHPTRSGAIAALAEQFDESSEWVELNMGTSNDLGPIHRNLVRAKMKADGIDW